MLLKVILLEVRLAALNIIKFIDSVNNAAVLRHL
jgi:hypothetical protein